MNIKNFNPNKEKCKLEAVKLDWNEAKKESYYESLDLIDGEGNRTTKLNDI